MIVHSVIVNIEHIYKLKLLNVFIELYYDIATIAYNCRICIENL